MEKNIAALLLGGSEVKGALHHPLAGLLSAIVGIVQAARGPRAVYLVPRSNGSARVRRAAVKARNVARNRGAHHG
jgi:hypothetical protein